MNRIDLHQPVVDRAVCIDVHRIGAIVRLLPRNGAQDERIDGWYAAASSKQLARANGATASPQTNTMQFITIWEIVMDE
ncbi:hypothetical protein QFZ98_004537 [Paraburkholderia youngii]